MEKKLTALILSLGIAVGGFFPGYYYYKTQTDNRTVSVKGLAEMDVKADLALWNIKIKTTGNELSTTQQALEKNKALIIDFLKEQGFKPEDILSGPVNTNDLMANPYRDSNSLESRYILSQTLTVRSEQVDLVQACLQNLGTLVAKGVVFESQEYGSPVSYLFTGLNQIKPQMLQKATQNARAAAEEFAKNSHSRVGKIKRAQQGVFTILPREQTPSATESEQIFKTIRVVSTVEYLLD